MTKKPEDRASVPTDQPGLTGRTLRQATALVAIRGVVDVFWVYFELN